MAVKPTREELQKFLPSQRLIRAFEALFDVAPEGVDESIVNANTAVATANAALGQLTRIAQALELLATAPPGTPDIDAEDVAPPVSSQVSAEDLAPSSPVATESDDLDPPHVDCCTPLACGEAYMTNGSETVTVAMADTAYELDAGMSAGYTLFAVFGGSHYIEVVRAGEYLLGWSISAQTTNPNDEIEGGYMIDGSAQGNATAHTTVSAANAPVTMSATGYVQLAQGEQVSLYVKNHTAARDIVVEHASLTLSQRRIT